jgi:hypothetical protein
MWVIFLTFRVTGFHITITPAELKRPRSCFQGSLNVGLMENGLPFIRVILSLLFPGRRMLFIIELML